MIKVAEGEFGHGSILTERQAGEETPKGCYDGGGDKSAFDVSGLV
jgi:hypothetical protein